MAQPAREAANRPVRATRVGRVTDSPPTPIVAALADRYAFARAFPRPLFERAQSALRR